MSENARSAQGTLMYHRRLGSGAFNVIGELRDISGPELIRNTIETTAHNDPMETKVVGIKRWGDVTFTLGYLTSLQSHKDLRNSWNAGDRDTFYIDFTDGSRQVFSGFVTNMSPSMPVDDGFTMDVTIGPTGQPLFVDP